MQTFSDEHMCRLYEKFILEYYEKKFKSDYTLAVAAQKEEDKSVLATGNSNYWLRDSKQMFELSESGKRLHIVDYKDDISNSVTMMS